MENSDFITGITFRTIQPMTELQESMLFADNFYFESVNTVLPVDEEKLKTNIQAIWGIPKMSSLAIAAIINRTVSAMPSEQTYVNVGVWNGFTFFAGMINNPDKKCIGIDNFSNFGGPREKFNEKFNQYKSENHVFFEMDYVEYFNHIHKETIGCYFFDGPHDYKNQLLALEIAEPYFADGCIIIVDDTNRTEPRQATLDFINSRPHNYRIVVDRQTFDNGHPTFWNGIIIFEKVMSKNE